MWKRTTANQPEIREPSDNRWTNDLSTTDENYAIKVTDRLLLAAREAQATDLHIESDEGVCHLRWRVAGQLINVGTVPNGQVASILGRIKALARMVTYRSDIPQEGRLVLPDYGLEARVSTLPTLRGERIVIRLAVSRAPLKSIHQLGLQPELESRLKQSIRARSGAILICGPAGAGKTTTAYACLNEIASHSLVRNVVTLEDPIEIAIDKITQSQINPSKGFDWESGLKAILRQDPEVLFIGEIRDSQTAAVVFDAAQSGQLVLSTLHARSAAAAIRRLLDLQVPSHHLICGLNLLLCQRLLQRVCPCRSASNFPDSAPPPPCDRCNGTGIDGRLLFAEALPPIERDLAKAIVADADSRHIDQIALANGMESIQQRARVALDDGQISQIEWLHHDFAAE